MQFNGLGACWRFDVDLCRQDAGATGRVAWAAAGVEGSESDEGGRGLTKKWVLPERLTGLYHGQEIWLGGGELWSERALSRTLVN